MNKKLLIGTAAVFVTIAVLGFLIHGVLLMGTYAATASLWRPMEEMKMGVMYFVYLCTAFLFTLIFSKGYEGKGVAEGVRYGAFVGLLMSIPMAYGTYSVQPIPYSLALQWFLYGTLEYMICGIVVAMVYGKQALVSKAAAA